MATEYIKCADCKQQFSFTDGERKFFTSKGLSTPKRCKPCRDAKKQAKAKAEEFDKEGKDMGPDEHRGRRRDGKKARW